MIFYICTMFRVNISKGLELLSGHGFPTKIFQRGTILSKMSEEKLFLFSAHRLMMLYICTMFRENISMGFRVIEWTWLPH